jgi:SlyX protein
MSTAHDTGSDSRLTELEIKASFMEDTLDRLNEVVVRQQQQIDLLTRELLALRDQQNSGDPAAPRSLRDELPPHY